MEKQLRHVLVTGGNTGIGLALCKLLVTHHSCFVFLGSRSAEKGSAAVRSILEANPDAKGKIEAVPIDVADDASCLEAAAQLRAKGVRLYAVVNNAGVGFQTAAGGPETIINVNYQGPKRVTRALFDMIDPSVGRIVHTSSGAAMMWLQTCDSQTKTLFSDPKITEDQLDAAIQYQLAKGNLAMGGYGLSKAALCALTMVHAREHPNLTVTSLSPGFIDTNMTKGFGAKLTPEQGCVSAIKCLFGKVVSGAFYGSDGLRSPLTCLRDPGAPEYQGEANPDPAKYKIN